jgi:hypothetical protein
MTILPDPATLKGTVPTSWAVAAIVDTVDPATAAAILDRLAANDPSLAEELSSPSR